MDLAGSIELTYPHLAYLSVGNSSANLTLGRNKVSMGKGFTGNLGISADFTYQDYIKLGLLYNPVSYDCLIMAFDNNKDYESNPMRLGVASMNEPSQLVFVHKLSASLFKKVSLSLYEGCLQYGDNIVSNLKMLNPFMMFHNTNGYAASPAGMNNFFGFQLSASLARGLELNGQMIFDQIQSSNESRHDSTAPNAYGFLANVNYTFTSGDSIISCFAEGVYTNPALYLKDKAGSCSYYDVDLIVGNGTYWDSSYSDVSYLGYQYGPDSIVAAVGADIQNPNFCDIDFDARFVIHGEQGIRNRENQTDFNITGKDINLNPTSPTGVPEYRFIARVKLSKEFFDCMKVSAQFGYLNVSNYRNILNNKVKDFQCAVGISFDLSEHLFSKIIKN